MYNTIILAIVLLVCVGAAFAIMKRKKAMQNDTVNDQVYVGNLPYRVDEADLKTFFSQYGMIQAVKVVRNFKTGRSKGYAFVTYANQKQAGKALNAHGQELQGRLMVVRIAKMKQSLEDGFDYLGDADSV
jgi:cold-inducible RNA-binding protein